MNLHDTIMNIPCTRTLSHFATQHEMVAYKQGHRDARHAAAELSIGYVKLSEEQERMLAAWPAMVEALQVLVSIGNHEFDNSDEMNKARAAVAKALGEAG